MVVTTLLRMSITLMMAAAPVSSFFVLRMRPAGCSGVSVGSPLTSGITTTPVSKPERPSASFGNRKSATSTIIIALPFTCGCAKSASFQLPSTCGLQDYLVEADGDDRQVQQRGRR